MIVSEISAEPASDENFALTRNELRLLWQAPFFVSLQPQENNAMTLLAAAGAARRVPIDPLANAA